MMSTKPLIVDWKGLKNLGWPYSRAETWRRMEKERKRSKGSRRKGNFSEWVEPNPRPFPKFRKFDEFRNSHPVWIVSEVLAYFEAHSLPVTGDWNASD